MKAALDMRCFASLVRMIRDNHRSGVLVSKAPPKIGGDKPLPAAAADYIKEKEEEEEEEKEKEDEEKIWPKNHDGDRGLNGHMIEFKQRQQRLVKKVSSVGVEAEEILAHAFDFESETVENVLHTKTATKNTQKSIKVMPMP